MTDRALSMRCGYRSGAARHLDTIITSLRGALESLSATPATEAVAIRGTSLNAEGR